MALMEEFDCYIDNWKLDFSGESLVHNDTGEIRKLGEYPFRLLSELAGNAGKVLLKEELLAAVWPGRVVGINSLLTAVHSVRKAVDDDGHQQKIIHTVPKVGYCLSEAHLRQEPRKHTGPAEPEAVSALHPGSGCHPQNRHSAVGGSAPANTSSGTTVHRSVPERCVIALIIITAYIAICLDLFW
ncbi:winged helix-turn-helix domain-containing protein [Mangrovibacter plantisponsor]|uniref:DNA-binding winged helix-turn-helix (WHTH) protein n=1 Tax=Mangrovibacter plantisponsor TaxID=451513 RepID=A0A317PWK9_9ENTR|nr:winged helix-turn-helix domain-containing protein [Mangrovibacter plantisponsor]PWW05879.1 DNA-binding winged helix-turn-helix (wHTH) protein [Mangrovibacter plantisponsor]